MGVNFFKISTIIIFLVVGCVNSKHTIYCSKELKPHSWIIEDVISELGFKKTNKWIFKKVVWNDECSCGLIDVSANTGNSLRYYPFFIHADKTITPLFMKNSSKVVSYEANSKDSLFSLFKEKNPFFTIVQLDLIKNRLSFDQIYFGSPLALCTLDMIRDSLLMNVYTDQSNNTIIKNFKLKRNK